MSWSAHSCKACHHPVTHFQAPIPFGPPFAYALSWLCPACHARNIELCTLGPDEPKPGHCLECDTKLAPDGRCHDCGDGHADLVARIHARCGSPPEIAAIRSLGDEGLYRVAFAAVHLRLQVNADDIDALWTKAKLLTEVLRPAQAAPILRRILAGDHGPCPDPAVAVDLGIALANSGDNHAAIQIYERFLAEQPTHQARAVVLTNIGACWSSLGHVAQAESFHRQAIAADPERMGSRWNLFANLCKAGRLADAVEVLEDTAVQPFVDADDRANLHGFRGQLLTQLGRFEDALAAFDCSRVEGTAQPDLQLMRARVLVELGRLDQARVALHHVIEHRPHWRLARELLAQITARTPSN